VPPKASASGVAIVSFVSDLRAVNTRLRQVVADKDELATAQQALIALQREQLEPRTL
jgi:hypothetical protein